MGSRAVVDCAADLGRFPGILSLALRGVPMDVPQRVPSRPGGGGASQTGAGVTGWLFGAILIGTIVLWVFLATTATGTPLRRVVRTLLAATPLLLFSTVVIVAFLNAPAGE